MSATIRDLTDMESWLNEWNNYEENLKKLRENEYTNLLSLMDEHRVLQAKLTKNVDMQKKNMKAFDTSFRRIKKSENSANKDVLLEMSNKMNNVYSTLEEFQQALPRLAGWFLKTMVGEINVSLYQGKQHYKVSYEKFKLRLMMIVIVFSLVNLTFIQTRLFDALFNGLLVWYYSSLTLQEQILRANGSRIKGWYVVHHYFSILLSGCLLIWPTSESYQQFRKQFYIFALYLSFVHCLEYYYQSGILYKLQALGHGRHMDTTQDGVRSWKHGIHSWKLRFLIPFLIVGYVFQFYNAYTLYLIGQQKDCREWQITACAILFVIIAVGNVITLCIVLVQKKIIGQ